jgi:uncharacterized protein
LLDHMVPGFAHPFRSPILHRPSEAGLSYQDVTFPSADGVPIEGWFIPCVGSDRLVVANHPLYFSRSGLPSHLEPWKSLFGETGNDFEVNFVPDFKILHDAGFNVLAYDFRNFGHSGAANGGIQSAGIYLQIKCSGEVGFVHSLIRLSGAMNGNPVNMWLRETNCLRKIDGVWLLVHDHVSVPMDFETGQALTTLQP